MFCGFTDVLSLLVKNSFEYHDLIKNERSPKRRVMLEKKRERQEQNHVSQSFVCKIRSRV